MIIDAHAHAAGEYSTVESLMATTEKYGIEKVVLCTSPKNILNLNAKPPKLLAKKSLDSVYLLNKMVRLGYKYFMKDNGDGNSYVFEMKTRLPDTILQFFWVDPQSKEHMDNLRKNIDRKKPNGIKLHQSWSSFKIDGTEFRDLVDIARVNQLPIFIHLYSKKDAFKLSQFIKSNKDVTFIIAHLIGMDIFKQDTGHLKNVYFDTSGSERIQVKDILDAVNTFGYEHVVFGSDTPFAVIQDQINKIDSLNLSDNIKEHIYRLNIKNILGI